jgi:penicillin-binding protein 2
VNTLNNQSVAIRIFIILVGFIFVVKLFIIQVYDSSYKFSADSNTQRVIIQYPSRGLVFDRNGKLLVSNQAVYDVMVVPRDIEAFDTTEFINALGITKDELLLHFKEMRQNIKSTLKSKKISPYRPSIFLKQVSAEQYGRLQEKIYKFKGFFVQRRTLRKYEYPNAAHIFGYIGEVSESMIKEDPYYTSGDYKGINGIEQTYEKELRGKKGAKVVLVDVHGREKGPYRNGKYDTTAVVGKNITLSIDIEIQKYAELLMQNKIGSVVAIEPSTGEILALVSSPGYDPSLLIGRVRSSNYELLRQNPKKPLINRPLQALYPPGSTFKTINALIGLQEGVLTEDTRFPCSMGYHIGGLTVGCHSHMSPLNLTQSIQFSCNGYYSAAFRKIIDNPIYGSPKKGLDKWKNYMIGFGLGYRLGVDFSNENKGFIPNSEYYNGIYRNSWNSVTVISLGIGQAELLLTPIQMANMCATISNRGYFFTPHVIKSISDGESIPEKFTQIHKTSIDAKNFTPVINGMEMAVWGDDGGTAGIARIPNISICGKTGTAQNPHGKDHSIFIAFAPKDNPKIAISVYVENAGFGAAYAAPIASLLIEKYLTDSISVNRKPLETRMIEADLIPDENGQ